MTYTVETIKQSEDWDAFVKKQQYTPFVQSPSYGSFYASLGEKQILLGVYVGQTLVGGCQVVSVHAKRGNFLYLPYGPIAEPADFPVVLRELTDYLRNNFKQYHFIRVSPFIDDTPEHKRLFSDLGYKDAPTHVLAETTWLLALQSEDQMLADMKKNHRNLIRRCQRELVRVDVRTDNDALAAFNELHDITARRHRFRRFSRQYIEKEFHAFAAIDQASVYLGYLPDGRLDSAAIIMTYGNMAAYRHGASLGLDKKLPTSYLVQWDALCRARKNGVSWYNFWGIAPEGSAKTHPFFGITHFKKGFGGMQKNLLHCQDLPLSHFYALNWSVETFRNAIRGFDV